MSTAYFEALDFLMEANAMNPDKTAPCGAVGSRSILFAIKITY